MKHNHTTRPQVKPQASPSLPKSSEQNSISTHAKNDVKFKVGDRTPGNRKMESATVDQLDPALVVEAKHDPRATVGVAIDYDIGIPEAASEKDLAWRTRICRHTTAYRLSGIDSWLDSRRVNVITSSSNELGDIS